MEHEKQICPGQAFFSWNAYAAAGGMAGNRKQEGSRGMEQKVYKLMRGAGAANIAVGVIHLVVGIVTGVLLIIAGSKLIAGKSKILF